MWQGLLPVEFNELSGLPMSWEATTLTVGAMADSAYEYFLKVWLLTGKKVLPPPLLLPEMQFRLVISILHPNM